MPKTLSRSAALLSLFLSCIPAFAQVLDASILGRLVDIEIPGDRADEIWQARFLEMVDAVEREGTDARETADIATMRALLALPRPPFGTDETPLGDWQVRSLQVSSLTAVVYSWFNANIRLEGDELVFRKDSGSQRTAGLLLRDGDRHFVYLGARYYDNEAASEHSAFKDDPTDADRDRNAEGFLFKLAADRMLMVFGPRDGRGEIYELKR